MADTEKTDSTTWTSLEDYRLLGNSGLRVSPLCMGARQIFVAVFYFLLLFVFVVLLMRRLVLFRAVLLTSRWLVHWLLAGGGSALRLKLARRNVRFVFFFSVTLVFLVFLTA